MEEFIFRKVLVQSIKIAVGSSLSIYFASKLGLNFPASAGSIALLTIVTTKMETIRLSVYRILTFGIAVFLAMLLFQNAQAQWFVYGVFVFIIVMICESLGWQTSVSVNALIGTHFLQNQDFSLGFIENEFFLVAIGISVATVLNLFHFNNSQKENLTASIKRIEENLQMILGELAAYLSGKDMQRDVWADIRTLENQLREYTKFAYEYDGNIFKNHSSYYREYFEMRMKQCNILHNLHYEMKKIRKIPKQAKIVAEYMIYLMDYITEKNIPTDQLQQLEDIFAGMQNEPLPDSRVEFESRAILYHILMDLEEFLVFKKRFIDLLDKEQKKIYWN